MEALFVILSLILSSALILNQLSFISNKTPLQIVDDMGQGFNLGNSFDCYNSTNPKEILTPDDQLTLCGNPVPTRETITKIKQSGFKTIRLPVNWMHFINELDEVNSDWMSRVKEAVDWAIRSNMYCILTISDDEECWLSEGEKAKKRYINLWKQIAKEFIEYDQHLIFESMSLGNYNDYIILLSLTQAFVDTIRDSGGNNYKRLLLINGLNSDFDSTCTTKYKLPYDPANKLGISINYYFPDRFTKEPEDNKWTWIDDLGQLQVIEPFTKWGEKSDYTDMVSYFETLRTFFIKREIPVIINKTGVLTKQNKEPESIRRYLKFLFSLSNSYKGIMSCLWDTSNQRIGEYNYFNRENNQWYDEQIRSGFKNITKGRYVKPTDYFIYSNVEETRSLNSDGNLVINFGLKRPIKVIVKISMSIRDPSQSGFGLIGPSRQGNTHYIGISCLEGKKQYDGNYLFNFEVKDKEFQDYVRIEKWWGNDYFSLNYLGIEFEENYSFFNFEDYIKALSN